MPDYSTFIGIDPGKTGAIAVLQNDGIVFVDLGDTMGRAQPELVHAAVSFVLQDPDGSIAMIEMPMTVPKESTSTAQKLGISIGEVRMLMTAFNIPYTMVDPRRWKRTVFFGYPEGAGKLDKAALRALAVRLYPRADIGKRKDAGRAEALLIAHYCWLMHGGPEKVYGTGKQ